MLQFGSQVQWVGNSMGPFQLSVCQKQFQYFLIGLADSSRWLLPTHDSNSLLPWLISNVACSGISRSSSNSRSRNSSKSCHKLNEVAKYKYVQEGFFCLRQLNDLADLGGAQNIARK